MAPITTLGENTKTVFLKGIQSHQLHHEFEVAAGEEITKGMPVKLDADGNVVPADAANAAFEIIGYSIHNGKEGEFVTVGMKAYAVVWAQVNAAVDAGPVEFEGKNSTDPMYMSYKTTADATNLVGWALDAATAADELIRVAIV